MMTSAINLISVLAAYGVGCLTVGYYLVRWRTGGEDIRGFGSGNVGARNVGRRLGTTGFAATFLLDFLKGLLVLVLATKVGLSREALTAVLFAVIAGHNWPVQLRFRGGKGIAVSMGGLLAYSPPLFLSLLLVFAPLWLGFRHLIIAGMAAYVLTPLVALACGWGSLAAFAMSGTALLVVTAHRHNLREALAGWAAARDSSSAPRNKPSREQTTS